MLFSNKTQGLSNAVRLNEQIFFIKVVDKHKIDKISALLSRRRLIMTKTSLEDNEKHQ